MEDLKIGAEILREFVKLYEQKEAARTVTKVSQKELQRQAAERVCFSPCLACWKHSVLTQGLQVRLAFIDDRKTKEQRDEMERQARLSRGSSAAPSTPLPSAHHARSQSTQPHMPGEGERLVAPPPYEAPPASDGNTVPN